MAEWYTGPVWTVSFDNTGEEYAFGDEGAAEWFCRCRTVHRMVYGSKPADGGNLFMTPEERDAVLKKEPGLEKFIRRVYGSKEFIQGIERYCFWLVDASPADIKRSKILHERVKRVKEFRLASTDEGTRKSAETPHLFQGHRQPTTNYLLIPCHSSKERMYVPMGYVSPDVIVTNAAFSLPNATPYHFGVLTSSAHMSWMRRVCGRLRVDYRYSSTIVYNTFIWPMSSPLQTRKIELTGQAILDARAKHPECTFADLYDEVSMPQDLRRAHQENDAAVIEAYGWPKGISEEDIAAELFTLYGKELEKKNAGR
ncbi:MAG: hypothetical protein IJT02_03965 [Synergistaceae bacterium]|nr:hypothetical protein [Synergistaceae bacterium]